MSRLLSPDSACVEVDAPSGRRYRGRVLDVADGADARALRAAGYTPAGLGTPRSAGFVCGCGFRGWFRTCGRCGAACTREER